MQIRNIQTLGKTPELDELFRTESIKIKRLVFFHFSGIKIPPMYKEIIEQFDEFYKGKSEKTLTDTNQQEVVCRFDENETIRFAYVKDIRYSNYKRIVFSELRRERRLYLIDYLYDIDNEKYDDADIPNTILDAAEQILASRNGMDFDVIKTERLNGAYFNKLMILRISYT